MSVMMKGKRSSDTSDSVFRPIGGLDGDGGFVGSCKGRCVQHPEVMLPPNAFGKLDVGGALGLGVLSVIKDLGMKEPYVGQCELKTGEIGDDLTYYFATSEQVPTSVGLGVLMEKDNTVKQAGGFIIQLMPFTSDEVIGSSEAKLNVKSVTALFDAGMTPEQILEELLGEFGVEINEKIPTGYQCDCSRERIEKALISLGKKELEDRIHDGETIEVGCQFCNKKYPVTVEELKSLLARSRR